MASSKVSSMSLSISRSLFQFLAGGLAAFIFLSCAGQVPPPGGPVDTVPPEIIRTVPDTNAVRVETSEIELEFSKYVDRRSVEESIFISPPIGDLEYAWSGTSVRAKFHEPLRPRTTYVVNIGTDVKDVRAGNRMARGFTLAFATGDSIDRGEISGRVFDEKPEGVMIFAYALNGIDPDTLNPSHTKPDFIMQTGTGGLYTLSHLSFNTYRVIAVRDQYRDLIYDKQIDQYGVTTRDIVLSAASPYVRGINFRLSQEDTTRPFLTAVRALDRRHLVIGFSEPLDSLTFGRGRFTVLDTVSGKKIPIAVPYLNPQTPSSAGMVMATPLDSGTAYRLVVRDVWDRNRNSIDTLHASADFVGSGSPDTLKPILTIPFRDSTKGIAPVAPLRLIVSEPVDTLSVVHAVTLIEAGKNPVNVLAHWLSPLELELRTRPALLFNTWYRLQVVMDSVRDVEGNGYKDSVLTVRFQTLDERTTGTIEGTVSDSSHTFGRIVVTAASADASEVRQKSITLPGPGPFRIDRLPEGLYSLSAYQDADSSGTYGYGLPFPFKPSEHFAVYKDTVKVRARWGVQGVAIGLR
jgi:hypothetical protein